MGGEGAWFSGCGGCPAEAGPGCASGGVPISARGRELGRDVGMDGREGGGLGALLPGGSHRAGLLFRHPAGRRRPLAWAEVVGGISADVLARGPQRLHRELDSAYWIAAGLGQRVEAAVHVEAVVGEAREAHPAQVVGDC